MGVVTIRSPIHRESVIPKYGIQIGQRGDRWEEEFIKSVDFSTMDDPTDWSYLFRNSKAYDFDLGAMNSTDVTNMNHMFQDAHAGTLRLAGLTIGEETSAVEIFGGEFDAIDFTNATFYSLPSDMFNGATVRNGIQLRTLDVSHLTSLAGMFKNARLASLDLTGFNTSTITNMNEMFNYAEIPVLTGLNALDYSNVVSAAYMLGNCKIPVIDLSGANFSSLVNGSYMFYDAATSLSLESITASIDLTGVSFPVLENAYEMFYQYTYNDVEPILIIDDTYFGTKQLNAQYMFAYINMPNRGLDLSGLADVKIINSQYMFHSTKLGETDFTYLDFSNNPSISSTSGPFDECETPIIHLKTSLPSEVSGYNYFYAIYRNKADNVILELKFPPSCSRLGYVVYPQYSDLSTTYLIKNSEIYASDLSYFIYDYSCNTRLTFQNSIIHMGDNGNMRNFFYCYGSNTHEYETFVDMRDLVIEGVCRSSNSLMGYGTSLDRIYFPDTGISFAGQLNYFCYGVSRWDSETQRSYYKSPILYNLDKLDMSNIQSMSYVFYYCNGTYDLSNWDMSSLASMNYVLEYCYGNYNLSNWDTENLVNINGIAYSFDGNLDLRNWDLSNCTYIYGITDFNGGSIDFDGWNIPINKTVSNCYLVNAGGTTPKAIYLPNTLYQPNTYTGTMFGGSTWGTPEWIVDVYTNATDVETQGWKFEHIYTEDEPYGYRLHLGTTHDNFLEAIGGD